MSDVEAAGPAQPTSHIGRRLSLAILLIREEIGHGGGVGVVAASDATGREKSQVSRGLKVLHEAGYAERDESTLTYTVGPRLLQFAASASHPLLTRHAPVLMETLALETDERVELIVRSGEVCLTIDTFASANPVQSPGWVGRQAPLIGSAAGAVLTASDANAAAPGPIPEGAGATSDQFTADQLRQAREHWAHLDRHGFAVGHDDPAPGIMCLACPIPSTGLSRDPIAALSLSGPEYRISIQTQRLSELVRHTAANIGRALRASGTEPTDEH